MLRMRPFDLHQPESLTEALALMQQHGDAARLLAGGTDVLPSLKLGQTRAAVLVSLRRLPELQGIDVQGGELRIGAASRLAEVAADEQILAHLPALAFAASRVAGPQIRNMGTLGGNLCLDTRCRYINQSDLWREALGGCLKSHGKECHVVPGGQGCVAALSSDTAPVLIAYGALLDLAGPVGVRTLPVAELYAVDGCHHLRLQPGEVIVAVRVPLPEPGTQVTYRKWSVRKSIDFPLVSVALRLDCAQGLLRSGLLAVGALNPRPRVLTLERWAGRAVDDTLAAELGQYAFERCRPLPNIPYDAEYRRERIAVEVRRAVLDLTRPCAL